MFAPSVDGAFGYALRHLKILGHRENKKSDHVVSRHEIRQTYESHSPAMLAVHIRPGSDAGSRMQYGVHRFRRIVRVGGFYPVRVCDSGDDGESFIWTVGLSFPLFEGQFDELCAYSFPNAEAASLPPPMWLISVRRSVWR